MLNNQLERQVPVCFYIFERSGQTNVKQGNKLINAKFWSPMNVCVPVTSAIRN
jgi:hypothetical protein